MVTEHAIVMSLILTAWIQSLRNILSLNESHLGVFVNTNMF